MGNVGSPEGVMELGRQALWVLILLGAPIMLTALVVGMAMGVFQAATQINEPTLAFVPRLLAVILILYLAGPWMLQLIIDFAKRLYVGLPSLIG
jgi:flagellar biosynthetic protein FliQ